MPGENHGRLHSRYFVPRPRFVRLAACRRFRRKGRTDDLAVACGEHQRASTAAAAVMWRVTAAGISRYSRRRRRQHHPSGACVLLPSRLVGEPTKQQRPHLVFSRQIEPRDKRSAREPPAESWPGRRVSSPCCGVQARCCTAAERAPPRRQRSETPLREPRGESMLAFFLVSARLRDLDTVHPLAVLTTCGRRCARARGCGEEGLVCALGNCNNLDDLLVGRGKKKDLDPPTGT